MDIEFCRDLNSNIAKRFFTDEEYKQILLDATPNKAFLKIWTQKEAYIKLFGLNLLEILKPPIKIKTTHYKCLEFEPYVIWIGYTK